MEKIPGAKLYTWVTVVFTIVCVCVSGVHADLSGETMGICGAGVAFSVSVRRLLGGLGLSGLLSMFSSSFVTSSPLEVAFGFTDNIQKWFMNTRIMLRSEVKIIWERKKTSGFTDVLS